MDEMDPCECIWSHEMAMRRLMSMLRQGQAYCTDTECIDELPGAPGPRDANIVLMTLLFAFAILMYMFRPQRGSSSSADDIVKNNSDNNGPPAMDRDEPPPPPPAVN